LPIGDRQSEGFAQTQDSRITWENIKRRSVINSGKLHPRAVEGHRVGGLSLGGHQPDGKNQKASSLRGGSFEASAGQDVNVSGAIIESSNIKLSSRRDIRLGGRTAGPAKLAASGSVRLQAQQGMKITSSSQLLRLTQLDNPQLWIEAANGNLEVIRGSSVDADIVNMISQRGTSSS
jgi:hypothetical protein